MDVLAHAACVLAYFYHINPISGILTILLHMIHLSNYYLRNWMHYSLLYLPYREMQFLLKEWNALSNFMLVWAPFLPFLHSVYRILLFGRPLGGKPPCLLIGNRPFRRV